MELDFLRLSKKSPTPDEFREHMYRYYNAHGRIFPWRTDLNPYAVLVSEIMLQQTQAPRVVDKFTAFMQKFPSFEALALSALADVFEYWQGLGYNRRANFLHQSAKIIVNQYRGHLPNNVEEIDALPGIGPATAAAIAAYAFNAPVVFIETNIRRVFIHVFFQEDEGIDDKKIMPLVEKYLDHENPRLWYSALMDYGTMLAKELPNPNRRSKHYTKQTIFKGSVRQLRGQVLKLFLEHKAMTEDDIQNIIRDNRLPEVLRSLETEHFILKLNGIYKIR